MGRVEGSEEELERRGEGWGEGRRNWGERVRKRKRIDEGKGERGEEKKELENKNKHGEVERKGEIMRRGEREKVKIKIK